MMWSRSVETDAKRYALYAKDDGYIHVYETIPIPYVK